MGLASYLPELASNHNTPDLCLLTARITGMSHQHPAFLLDFKKISYTVLFLLAFEYTENKIKREMGPVCSYLLLS
jgi:hypothetical protein